MRRSRALILPVLMLLILSACGGSSSSTGNGNGGQSQSAEQSQAAEESQAAESQAAESQGSGQSAGDLDSLVQALTPPHSSELSKTTAAGGVFIAWNSTDSVESLKSFYESAIPGTGMIVISTSSASGTYAWVFAKDESSSYGGSVTIGPTSDGTDGGSVILTATTE